MTLAHPVRLIRVLMILFALASAFVSVASAEGKEKVLYSFQGGASDGQYPAGGVVFDKAGNLYGATTDGGGECPPAQCGIVFQLAPAAKMGDPWTETVLHIFQGPGSDDGNTPAGSLIIDSAGNLYGTTGYGGTGNCILLGTKVGCGTVYELSPPTQEGGAWTETVLYSFPTPKQGYLPNGNLVFDSAGNLYGATMFGGGEGTTCDSYYQYCGAVFELSPPKKQGGAWTEKVLHGFAGIETGKQEGDGANPNGGLALDSEGGIYGTTYTGGFDCAHHSGQGCGTAFKLTPPTKKGTRSESILHRFKAAPDGAGPAAGLAFDRQGNLYGTTVFAGVGNSASGTVFELGLNADSSWTEQVLYTFQEGNDGAQPRGSVLLNTEGEIYGTASIAGAGEAGAIFRLREDAGNPWTFTVIYDFTRSPDGFYPTGPLIFGAASKMYGTTQEGGDGQSCQPGCGTVFATMP